jgi:hypothetical protein
LLSPDAEVPGLAAENGQIGGIAWFWRFHALGCGTMGGRGWFSKGK